MHLFPARTRLGDALVARGHLTAEDLSAALAAQREQGPNRLLGETSTGSSPSARSAAATAATDSPANSPAFSTPEASRAR